MVLASFHFLLLQLLFLINATKFAKSQSRTYTLLRNEPFNNGTFRPRRESAEDGPIEAKNSPNFRPIKPIGKAPADPCLLKCKDDFMLYTGSNKDPIPSWRMESAIGSPLHALIEMVSTDNSLDRVAMECNYHENFLICLDKCGGSAARKILSDGQEGMKTICRSFKKDKEFLRFVLPCLAKNGQRIGKSCQLHWSLMENDIYEAIQYRQNALLLQNTEIGQNVEEDKEEEASGFQRPCSAMTSYTDCHLRAVGQLCHRRALPFFVRLNAKSFVALLKCSLTCLAAVNLTQIGWNVNNGNQRNCKSS